MRGLMRVAAVGMVLSLGVLVEPAAAACPVDSVQSGTVCMDKYEASVWFVPAGQASLITKIRNGTVTLANLTSAGAVAAGVIQLGFLPNELEDQGGCPPTGKGCVNVYAVSIPGVTPAHFINWFQAAAAARNSLKRLPTNQEWQVAALGTPDPGEADNGSTTCNTGNLGPGVVATGSRSNCVSDVGAFDMVGNLSEWVADWADLNDPDNCFIYPEDFGGDRSCVGGPGSGIPGAFDRGGGWSNGTVTWSGVFAVNAGQPFPFSSARGFRCAR